MQGPDPRRRARPELVAAIIGAEAGAAIGVLTVGATPLAPLGLAAIGAGIGSGAVRMRETLIRRRLRSHLRAGR